MNSWPDCLVEQDEHVLVVTMNRPEARNALSAEMLKIMREAWDRVDEDDVGALLRPHRRGRRVLRGRRPEGHDQPTIPATRSFDAARIEPLLKGRRLTKPLIAAVEGPAIAGGTEILQATDIRVAGESARFGVSEARWGLYPLGGSAVRLPRQIPYTVAADILLTGRHLRAAEALRIGLIGHVVPDGQALPKAMEIAAHDRGERPTGGTGDPPHDPRDRRNAGERGVQARARIGMEVFRSEDAKEGPAFARSASRTPQPLRAEADLRGNISDRPAGGLEPGQVRPFRKEPRDTSAFFRKGVLKSPTGPAFQPTVSDG